jgi:hypothetical protein
MLNNELKLGVLDERIVPFLNILTICADEATKGQNCLGARSQRFIALTP